MANYQNGEVANNGMQGTMSPHMQGVGQTGFRAGSSDDDPMVNFWMGAAAPTSMQTHLGPAAQAQQVNGLNSQALGAQSGLLQQLQNQANGVGPSLAQMQLQQGTDQNLRQQAALAASGRSPGLASYQAMQNQGAAGQQMAGQAAQARLAEQYQAQQGLAGLAAQMQGQQLNNAGLQQQVNLANMGALNQFGLAQGQLSQQDTLAFNQMMANQLGAYNSYLYNKDTQRTQDNDQFRNQMIGGAASAGGQLLQMAAM